MVELDGGCIAALGYWEHYIGSGNYNTAPFFAYFDSLFDFPLNVGMETLQPAYTVTVTPNPVITQATVSCPNEQHEPVVFTLYDVTGKAVQQEKTSAPQIIITNNKWSGLFIYELRFKDGRMERGKLIFNSE